MKSNLNWYYYRNKNMQTEFCTRNEQKNMNDTKYAYAIREPHSSPVPFPACGSHAPLRQANIMLGHASPVAHLN